MIGVGDLCMVWVMLGMSRVGMMDVKRLFGFSMIILVLCIVLSICVSVDGFLGFSCICLMCEG